MRTSAMISERKFGGIDCPEPGKTIQSQKEEADINTIVKRFGLSGQLPQNVRVPLNDDFDGIFDYQSALNLVIEADRAFGAMPAEVRKRFGNDPADFVDFVSNPDNQDEARKLGIAMPAKVEDPVVPILVSVVNPAEPGKEPPK